jgi:hypothetical protein
MYVQVSNGVVSLFGGQTNKQWTDQQSKRAPCAKNKKTRISAFRVPSLFPLGTIVPSAAEATLEHNGDLNRSSIKINASHHFFQETGLFGSGRVRTSVACSRGIALNQSHHDLHFGISILTKTIFLPPRTLRGDVILQNDNDSNTNSSSHDETIATSLLALLGRAKNILWFFTSLSCTVLLEMPKRQGAATIVSSHGR